MQIKEIFSNQYYTKVNFESKKTRWRGSTCNIIIYCDITRAPNFLMPTRVYVPQLLEDIVFPGFLDSKKLEDTRKHND